MKVCGRDVIVKGKLLRIAAPELDSYETLQDPEEMLQGLRESPLRVDLFTFMQGVTEHEQKFRYPMEWDNLAALEISTFDHWWNHQIRSYPRNRARQAEKKGVTIRELPFDGELVRGMWEVYNESPVRQGKRNVHYGKDVETVRREEETFLERSIFVGAHFEGHLIGFAKLVTDEGRTQANLMNIVAMVGHRDKATANALIAEAVRACANRGIRHLLYQNFTYGNKKPDSLTNFKEVNGFQRVDVPRYYVPLTAVGRTALRFGLHHRLVDRLPEELMAKFRALRGKWYGREAASPASGS
jgi:hypothetical protein